jgi:hypothetical protein
MTRSGRETRSVRNHGGWQGLDANPGGVGGTERGLTTPYKCDYFWVPSGYPVGWWFSMFACASVSGLQSITWSCYVELIISVVRLFGNYKVA